MLLGPVSGIAGVVFEPCRDMFWWALEVVDLCSMYIDAHGEREPPTAEESEMIIALARKA